MLIARLQPSQRHRPGPPTGLGHEGWQAIARKGVYGYGAAGLRPTGLGYRDPGGTCELSGGTETKKGPAFAGPSNMARPKRFELLTPWFVAKYSIQLSYGRVEGCALYADFAYLPSTCRGWFGGDGGIRTLDAGLSPHAPLAGEYLQPLGHVSEPPRIVAEGSAERHLRRWPCRARRRRAGRVPRVPCTCPRPRRRS